MMIPILLTTFLMSPTDFSCAVMGNPSTMKSKSVDFAGMRFPMCCAGCDGTFSKQPTEFLTRAEKEKKTIGFSLFDPVSGLRIDLKKLPGEFVDHKGVRYFFGTSDARSVFAKDPDAFTKVPEKEVLSCSVMGHGIDSYGTAGAFADFDGVRYYFCCGDCRKQFLGNPSKFAEASREKAKSPQAKGAKGGS